LFTVQPFEANELGNASFVVADPNAGLAAVIDPVRDVDQYLTHTEKLGFKVVRALDTHTHNDFISGARELKALAGSAVDPLEPDQEVKVGALTIRAMHTPGHTPDHKSYLLVEDGSPKALFSGGAVMVGGTARTDLFSDWNRCGPCRSACAPCPTTWPSIRHTAAARSAASAAAPATRPRSARSASRTPTSPRPRSCSSWPGSSTSIATRPTTRTWAS
jgi:hypothetical protein